MITDSHPIYDRKVDSARQYWLKVLSRYGEDAVIPGDRSRGARGPVEDRLALTISGVTFERLSRLTTGSSFLLYVTLVAVVKVCLYKYTRSRVIAVGGPSRRLDGAVFELPHVLVMVDDIDGKMPFRDLLLKIKETVAEAYQYQDYPFRDFIDELGWDEEKPFEPQVMVAVKDFHGESPSLGNGLRLSFERHADQVQGVVDFDSWRLSPDLIRRFTGDLPRILNQALLDPNISINELSALTPEERRQLVAEWNDTDRPFPEDRCVHELVSLQSANTPEAVAAVYDEQHLTYSELNRRSNQLASYLKARGVGPERRAALCLERSLEMVISILGVLKAGGVYVPLDPQYPPNRLGYMLNDAEAGFLLTRRHFLQGLPTSEAEIVCLDQEWERIEEESERDPEREVGGENLACLIYTSGSTGMPKGVMVAHRGLRNLVEAQIQAFRPDARARVLQFASLSFDASASEIFVTLVAGGSVRLCARENLMPGADLMTVLREHQITAVTLPPAALAILEDVGLSHLELVVAAGEACSAEVVERWAKGRRFLNGYGPTEATVCASIGECAADSHRQPTIGRPIANTRLYLLDHEMELVPVSGNGELYLTGAGLTRGYWRRPELTAERYIPNPFGSEAGGRLYRTGDLCRYLSDGELEFVGRADEQVKVRGYRIELGEIEAALNEHPSVKQSAVVATEDERGGKRLLGYVVGEDGATPAELKRHLREWLPGYMVPEAVMILDRMPVTANGKIDRQRLSSTPVVRDTDGRATDKHLVPLTQVEEILAGLFETFLKADRIERSDNFFERGGHSLLATQVASRIREVFGLEIGVKSIFETATVAGLARKIEEAMNSGEKVETPPLVKVFREDHRRAKFPLSYAQQSLWFIDQLDPGLAIYNSSGAMRVKGRLDLEVLERVINEIVRRHEVLRTRFEDEDGVPVQVIEPEARQRLDQVDLTGLTEEERAAEVERISREEIETGFDLQRGPLMRVKVLRLGEDETITLFTMHHIVSDAWSVGVLVREICNLYQAIIEGKPSPLPELEIQYADYAAWQRASLTGTVLEGHLAYWRKQLGGSLPVLGLPTDYPRPAVPSYRGAAKSFSLPPALHQSVKSFSRQEGVTLFMLLLAAFKTLLYKYTAQEDIIVGAAVANRNREELEPLIGYFVNMLPMRIDLGGNPRFREYLRRVKEVALSGYAHQDLPFERLVEEVQPERTLRQMPLFNVTFGVQNTPQEDLRLAGVEIQPMAMEKDWARFDLTLWVIEDIDEMKFIWTYSRDLFKEETVASMHDHFETLLSNIISRPDGRLTTLEISPPAETEPGSQTRGNRAAPDRGRPRSNRRRGISLSPGSS